LERQLKLIWDFRGPVSYQTAEHHTIHLKEYTAIENIPEIGIDSEKITDMHAIAYMVVNESDMKKVRDELKPHRGQLYQK